MDNIKIRLVTTSESDLNGIVGVYKSDDWAPWSKLDECTAWITKRLERGFYIQVAEVDGKIVAHGEWIITNEPERKFLYLGMLEINENYQQTLPVFVPRLKPETFKLRRRTLTAPAAHSLSTCL